MSNILFIHLACCMKSQCLAEKICIREVRMATKEQVENWIVEYALRKNYHDIVKVLLQQNREAVHTPNMEIRLMMCTLNKIMSHEDTSQFSLAANIVDFISRSVGKFCSVKLYGKIIYMLRMKMLLQHLQKDILYVLVLLNKNLPRCGMQFDNVNMKELKKLNERISSFRKFFLTLVASESTKQSYFADEYEKEFGEDFMITLKQFVNIFMDKINSHLPKTMLEQIFERKDLMEHHPTSVALEILLDCMHGKTSLSICELYDCWHLLNPDPDKGKNKSKTCVIKSSRVSDVESLDDEDLLSMRNISKRNPVTKSIPCSSKPNIVYSVIDIRQSQRRSSSSEGCTDQEMTSGCKDNSTARHCLHQCKSTLSTTAESLSDAPRLSHMKQKLTESQGTDIGNIDINISSQLNRNEKKRKHLLVDRNAESENQIESKKREMRDEYTSQRKSLVSSDQNEPEKKRCRKHIILKQQDASETNHSKFYSTRARVSKTNVTGSCGLRKGANKKTSEIRPQSSNERACVRRKGHNTKSSSNEAVISMNRKIDGTFNVEKPKSEATLVSKQPRKRKFQNLTEDESAEISFDSDRLKGKGSSDLDQCVTADEESTSYPEEVIVSIGTLESSDSESQTLRREMVVVPQSSENTEEQVYIISSSSDSHPDSGGSNPVLLDEQQGEEKQKEDCMTPIETHTINSSNSIILSSLYTAITSNSGPGDLESDSVGTSTHKYQIEESLVKEDPDLWFYDGINDRSFSDIDKSESQSELEEDRQDNQTDPSSVFHVYQIDSDEDDDNDYSGSSSVVPPSTYEDVEDVELWDLGEPIFNEHYTRPEGENLPELGMHLKNERMKLCLVKLYKKQDLVCTDSVTGQQLDIYV